MAVPLNLALAADPMELTLPELPPSFSFCSRSCPVALPLLLASTAVSCCCCCCRSRGSTTADAGLCGVAKDSSCFCCMACGKALGALLGSFEILEIGENRPKPCSHLKYLEMNKELAQSVRSKYLHEICNYATLHVMSG